MTYCLYNIYNNNWPTQIRDRFALTVDTSTCGVAALKSGKPVSISNTARPDELFAFVMNRIVIVPHMLTTTFTYGLSEVASLRFCEEKNIMLISGNSIS